MGRERRRLILAGVLLATLVAAAVPTVLELTARPRFNVIVLTVESWRADAVSPTLTPNLWQAAGQGLRFTNHRAISAWTVPNIVAVLEGLSPFEQGIHTRGNYLPAGWPLPLKSLGAAGWRVASLQAFANMDVYRNLGLEIEPGSAPVPWLARRAAAGQPFVLWYHYLDTHLPYAPPPPFEPDWRALLPPGDARAQARLEAVRTLPAIPTGTVAFEPGDAPAIRALHEGAVRAFDAWFGQLWAFLEASGLRRTTIVVVTADHGDEHLDHGQLGHASTNRNGHLLEELVHVPLFLWLPPGLTLPPGAPPPGSVITAANDHLDIMPTVLELLGQPPPRPLPGQSLLTLGPAGHPWSGLTSKAGFADPDPTHLDQFIAARLEFPWKLQVRQLQGRLLSPSLYQLEQDPGERHDLAASHPAEVERLLTPLRQSLATMRPPSAGNGEAEGAGGDLPAPHWLNPPGSLTIGAADVVNGFSLRWAGEPEGRYVIQYRAGEGAREIAGDLTVAGTHKDFGPLDRHYFETFIVPYRTLRLRVGPAGTPDRWSEWITVTVRP